MAPTLDETIDSNKFSTSGAGVRVVRVYLLRGKAAQENSGWLSVLRYAESGEFRLFLRDAKGYRKVSRAIALGMLSNSDQRSLLAIMKHAVGGGFALSEKNCIRHAPAERAPEAASADEAGREAGDFAPNPALAYGNQLESDEIFSIGRRPGVAWPLYKDHGSALATHSNSSEVAESLVLIARSRGWTAIRVSGSETFRHAVWVEAVAHGMRVRGYYPSVIETTGLARKPKVTGVQRSTHQSDSSRQRGKRASEGCMRQTETHAHEKEGRQAPVKGESDRHHHSRTYRIREDACQTDADSFTAYAQAVVMARIYENLLYGQGRGDFLITDMNEMLLPASQMFEAGAPEQT